MSRVIEPYAHEFYEEKIDTFLGLLKIYQNFYLSPKEQDRATFVVAEDDKRGVYGGAVIYPCMVFPSVEFTPEDSRSETLGKILSSFHPQDPEYWTARICFSGGNDSSTSLLETVKVYQHFYRILYKAFCYFAEKERTHSLTFTLRPIDSHVDHTLRILTYQIWPNLIEVRLPENPEGLFHGILPLKVHSFKVRPPIQKFLNFRSSPKAGVMTEGSSSLEEGKVS